MTLLTQLHSNIVRPVEAVFEEDMAGKLLKTRLHSYAAYVRGAKR
jgi:hypothetical protein